MKQELSQIYLNAATNEYHKICRHFVHQY